MWMADQIHDQTISDNVKGMQGRCQTLLGNLYDSIEQLMPMEVSAPRLKRLEAAAPPVDMVPRYTSARQGSRAVRILTLAQCLQV